MRYLNEFILQGGAAYLQLLIIILFFVLCVIFWVRSRTNKKLLDYYAKLMASYQEGNLESILMQLTRLEESNQAQLAHLTQRIEAIEAKLPDFISRLSLVRFKAFHDVGGDLSFSAAILDENGNGLVLTGIYGREETRVYAKDIKGYASEHILSDEEKQAIAKARTPS